MAQFMVYRLDSGQLVMDLQSDFADLPTRVVAPLFPVGTSPPRLGRIEPVLDIGDVPHVLHTGEMAGLPAVLLTSPVTDFRAQEDRIRRALDMVFSGF